MNTTTCINCGQLARVVSLDPLSVECRWCDPTGPVVTTELEPETLGGVSMDAPRFLAALEYEKKQREN